VNAFDLDVEQAEGINLEPEVLGYLVGEKLFVVLFDLAEAVAKILIISQWH
jgi:hypothetical protein